MTGGLKEVKITPKLFLTLQIAALGLQPQLDEGVALYINQTELLLNGTIINGQIKDMDNGQVYSSSQNLSKGASLKLTKLVLIETKSYNFAGDLPSSSTPLARMLFSNSNTRTDNLQTQIIPITTGIGLGTTFSASTISDGTINANTEIDSIIALIKITINNLNNQNFTFLNPIDFEFFNTIEFTANEEGILDSIVNSVLDELKRLYPYDKDRIFAKRKNTINPDFNGGKSLYTFNVSLGEYIVVGPYQTLYNAAL